MYVRQTVDTVVAFIRDLMLRRMEWSLNGDNMTPVVSGLFISFVYLFTFVAFLGDIYYQDIAEFDQSSN